LAKQHTVGVVGLGRIGGPVAQRFIKSEFPVMVWDIVPACCDPFENQDNARITPPGEMARRCSVIFFVVPSTVEIIACLKGKEGGVMRCRRRVRRADPGLSRKGGLAGDDRAGLFAAIPGLRGDPRRPTRKGQEAIRALKSEHTEGCGLIVNMKERGS
jgi:hypothetical protein